MLHLHRHHHRALPLSQGRLHFISERIAVQSGAVAPGSKYSCLTSNTPPTPFIGLFDTHIRLNQGTHPTTSWKSP